MNVLSCYLHCAILSLGTHVHTRNEILLPVIGENLYWKLFNIDRFFSHVPIQFGESVLLWLDWSLGLFLSDLCICFICLVYINSANKNFWIVSYWDVINPGILIFVILFVRISIYIYFFIIFSFSLYYLKRISTTRRLSNFSRFELTSPTDRDRLSCFLSSKISPNRRIF